MTSGSGTPDPGAAHAISIARRLYRTRRGWSWEAAAVDAAPGWYQIWQHGEQPRDIEFGGRIFLGPSDTVVHVSSNPLIHGFDETDEVLSELGGRGLTGLELANEILRRTSLARRDR